ncbi:MAG: HEAT repeat domain-containing protein [Candidatus Hodarchaeota archaeon]
MKKNEKKKLIRKIVAADKRTHTKIVQEARKYKEHNTGDTVAQVLFDRRLEVRRRMDEILGTGKWKNLDHVAALFRALDERNWILNHTIADFLAYYLGADVAISVFKEALNHCNPVVRQIAVEALSKLKDPRIALLLIKALYDEDMNIRLKAAEICGAFGDPYAVNALVYASTSKNRHVAQAAINALSKIGFASEELDKVSSSLPAISAQDMPVYYPIDSYISTLVVEHGHMCRETFNVSDMLDLSYVDVLIQLLDHMSSFAAMTPITFHGYGAILFRADEITNDIVRVLIILGSLSVNPLIRALKKDNWYVRRRAIEILGKINDPRVEGVLIVALKDQKYEVRAEAAEALAAIKNQRAIEALVQTFKDENSCGLVVTLLPKIIHGTSRPALIPLLNLLIDEGGSLNDINLKFALECLLQLSPRAKDLERLQPLLLSLIMSGAEEETLQMAKKLVSYSQLKI